MRDVIGQKQKASKWTRLACERQARELELYSGKDSPYYFDPQAAERVCMVVEQFPHIKGIWARAGNHLLLQPFQKFILTTVFGWKRTVDKLRRFRVVYIEMARKNAKSTLSSGVGNYLLACDGEMGAHVVSAAATRDQAKIVFVDSQNMARRTPGFLQAFGVTVHAHAISQISTASKYEAISAEDSNLDGLNIHAAMIDELHAHKTRGVWDVLETATGSRSQPLLWAITTAGLNRASVCYEQRGHVQAVLQGTRQDETYFGIIYTIDMEEGDDPFDEEVWIKANPNYGVSVYPDTLRAIAARAQSMPSQQTAFLTKHMCVWVNADHAWLDVRFWSRCANPALSIDDFAGRPCYIGIDLAMRSDIAAVVLLFPPQEAGEKWTVFGRYYLPEDVVQRSENAHYQGWETSGLLVSTPGNVTDCDYILDDLLSYGDAFEVQEIALDPWKNVPLVNALEKRGVTVPKVDVRQSPAVMSPMMQEFEALVMSQSIQHDGDPILTWMLSNVVAHAVSRQADFLYPRKESAERKIDGVLALLMALDRAVRNRNTTPDFAGRGLWSV